MQLFLGGTTVQSFGLMLLLVCISACAASTPRTAEQICASTEAGAMGQLECEFKTMVFEVKTEIKEFKILGEVHQIKKIELVDPEGARMKLTELAKKYVEFKTIRILMPGTMVTMEYLEDRINFQFDEQGLPKSVTRG